MPTLNSQQGTPEIPGYQPGGFEIPHPKSPEGQEAREGEVRVIRGGPGQEVKTGTESAEIIRQKILQHTENIKPDHEEENTQDDPVLNQLLADIMNGKKPVETLDVKTGKQARQITKFLTGAE